jgi:hypothetical protein
VTTGQLLQHRDTTGAQAPPLREEPAAERGATVHLQPFQELSHEQVRQLAQLLGSEFGDAEVHRPVDFDHVDGAVAEIDADGVAGRRDASTAGVVEYGPGLAQTPPNFASRVARDVAEELAQMVAGRSARGQRQIGDQGAYLARRRQLQRDTVTDDRHGAEHAQMQGRHLLGRAPFKRFHGSSHAGYHARTHGRHLP